jgi:importin-4
VLGVIAEGCCDAMRQGLSTILPRLLESIQDPEYFVRECACFALGQLSEYCQPEILHYHQKVLPIVFGALEDPKHTVQTTTCYVLEMFCENLRPETLRPFLNPLLTRLATLLQSPQKHTQEMALTAIAATAVAAEMEFLPYTETICSLLAPLLFNTEPNMHTMRGRSLECLGHVAVAIDSEHFARYFETGMQSAMQALLIDNDDLKEHSYVFFANTSKVMGHGFDPYLATLMPHLLGVVTENELITGDGLDDDEDEEEDHLVEDDEGSGDGKDMRLNVHEGFINNKKAALTAIGAMAEYTKESFAPYLESALDALIVDQMGALYSFHDIIRSEALECLPQLVCVACHATGVTSLPNKLQVIVLPELTAQVVRTAMKYLLMAMADDEAKSPVSTALEAACSIIARVGVACLTLQLYPEGPRIIDELMQRLLVIMNEKAPCQKMSNGDGQGDDEENDHDNVVMDSASELIGTLSKTIGDQMIPFFDQLQKPLMRFLKPTRPFSDRSMAIGCYAEVLLEFGPAADKYVEPLMPYIKVGLADQMESVRRNSAYCIGVLVQATGLALAPRFPFILQALHPLCTRAADKMASDTGGADVDNALSSVARIIMIGGADLIPLAQVLPVMLAALPLRSDTSEGPNIYGCLIDLVIKGDPSSISLLPLILNKFGEVLLADSNAVAEVKERVTLCLREQATGTQALQLNFRTALEQVTDPAIRASIQTAINT